MFSPPDYQLNFSGTPPCCFYLFSALGKAKYLCVFSLLLKLLLFLLLATAIGIIPAGFKIESWLRSPSLSAPLLNVCSGLDLDLCHLVQIILPLTLRE